MPRRRAADERIGCTQPPDLDGELARDELRTLAAEFVLEDVMIGSTLLDDVSAGSGRMRQVQLTEVGLGASKLRALELSDVIADRLDAANGDWGGAQMRRVRFAEARMTGLSLAEARIEQVSFKGCKLDYANFRHSTIERVSFEDCVLTGADFQGARLHATSFVGCRLVDTDFSRAKMSRVDLRGSELAPAGSVLGLRGATVEPAQLVELAGTLALEIGIVVARD